jgi:hypothetical protein
VAEAGLLRTSREVVVAVVHRLLVRRTCRVEAVAVAVLRTFQAEAVVVVVLRTCLVAVAAGVAR